MRNIYNIDVIITEYYAVKFYCKYIPTTNALQLPNTWFIYKPFLNVFNTLDIILSIIMITTIINIKMIKAKPQKPITQRLWVYIYSYNTWKNNIFCIITIINVMLIRNKNKYKIHCSYWFIYLKMKMMCILVYVNQFLYKN